ncbi:hypothetical protein CSQ89_00340 [Chitinimonas sp. BJB300]|nr:hypothetical protein CSQ89_00340 [Chitinimonas sp. BJB300]
MNMCSLDNSKLFTYVKYFIKVTNTTSSVCLDINLSVVYPCEVLMKLSFKYSAVLLMALFGSNLYAMDDLDLEPSNLTVGKVKRSASDDQIVSVVGKFVRRIYGDHYKFTGNDGVSICVEVDNDDGGVLINNRHMYFDLGRYANRTVRITGQVDREYLTLEKGCEKIKIDVEHIDFADNRPVQGGRPTQGQPDAAANNGGNDLNQADADF